MLGRPPRVALRRRERDGSGAKQRWEFGGAKRYLRHKQFMLSFFDELINFWKEKEKDILIYHFGVEAAAQSRGFESGGGLSTSIKMMGPRSITLLGKWRRSMEELFNAHPEMKLSLLRELRQLSSLRGLVSENDR
eukprot:GHVU01068572.1.p3 GENE.GHVU01068572.1~~GHVU01068572.1.p3  ORF type:complete len:135 (+),score=17.09 GHVU01068572.1:3793-4197(+)